MKDVDDDDDDDVDVDVDENTRGPVVRVSQLSEVLREAVALMLVKNDDDRAWREQKLHARKDDGDKLIETFLSICPSCHMASNYNLTCYY